MYESYADDVTKENGRMRLNALLQNSDAIITLEVCIAAGVTDTSAAYLFCFRQQLIITSLLLGNGVL